MCKDSGPTRRGFLQASAALGVGIVASGCASRGGESTAKHKDEKPKGEEEVSPAEDLMREHGLLNRVLLVYEECARRVEAKQDLSPEPLADSARLVRTLIEDYHEKLEEDHLFPRYRTAGKLVDLLDVLTVQHKEGRRTTERIEALATAQSLRDRDESRELVLRIRQFIRMYRPHEAREDTILFPVLHQIVSRNEYDALGEDFERIEHKQLGEEGFPRAVDRVAAIEKELGIYELAQFTPHP
ncbi:MAG: hemerythrin domain-containing protein [Planctomycetes bacterium]|nr:hemerythrin domain-containing protein [Planctomycetota bacterium]